MPFMNPDGQPQDPRLAMANARMRRAAQGIPQQGGMQPTIPNEIGQVPPAGGIQPMPFNGSGQVPGGWPNAGQDLNTLISQMPRMQPQWNQPPQPMPQRGGGFQGRMDQEGNSGVMAGGAPGFTPPSFGQFMPAQAGDMYNPIMTAAGAGAPQTGGFPEQQPGGPQPIQMGQAPQQGGIMAQGGGYQSKKQQIPRKRTRPPGGGGER